MQITGTREAFEAMIQERGIYKRLGVERSTVSTWKTYLKEGKSLSLDKMEEMLIRGGAIIHQEKVWEVYSTEDMVKKIAVDAEKIINTSNQNSFSGYVHVYTSNDVRFPNDIIEINDMTFQIKCWLDQTHPFILKTSIIGDPIPGINYFSAHAEPLQFGVWEEQLLQQISL